VIDLLQQILEDIYRSNNSSIYTYIYICYMIFQRYTSVKIFGDAAKLFMSHHFNMCVISR